MGIPELNTDKEIIPECVRPEIGIHLTGYKYGWLPDSQAQPFEQHLQNCMACSLELLDSVPLQKALREGPRLVAFSGRYGGFVPIAWWAWFRRSWSQVSLVVSMLLVAGMGYWFLPSAETSHFLSHATAHLHPLTANPSLIQGLHAFAAGDFPRAESLLQRALAEKPETYETNYLLGLVLLNESERDLLAYRPQLSFAIDRLQKAIALSEGRPDPIYVAQGYYYLARAYLMKQDTARAMDLLTRIERLPANNPGLDDIKQRAARLKSLCYP